MLQGTDDCILLGNISVASALFSEVFAMQCQNYWTDQQDYIRTMHIKAVAWGGWLHMLVRSYKNLL